jgi:hypothetical protein
VIEPGHGHPSSPTFRSAPARPWRILSACPRCGIEVPRFWYDAGDGRELHCDLCDWTWGADGQALTPDGHDVA